MSKSIVLLGHGFGIKAIIDCLKDNNQNEFKVVAVITHPLTQHEHDLKMIASRKEIYGEYAYNVFHVESDYGINLYETDDVNNDETISLIEKISPHFIVSVGCRNIIKSKFLSFFKNRVLNVHTTPLPRYRGAASDSWMILNGEWGKVSFGCCHFIDEKIDTGDIIATKSYIIPDRCYPIDLYKVRMSIIPDLFIDALKNLTRGDFKPTKQDNSKSTVFPRLFTPKDGKIDFKQFKGEDIVRFIYAFGYPFSGAYCFLEEKRLSILSARYSNSEKLHPFANGLIFGRDENGNYKVAVDDGFLLIEKIEIDGVSVPQNKIFRLGKFLK